VVGREEVIDVGDADATADEDAADEADDSCGTRIAEEATVGCWNVLWEVATPAALDDGAIVDVAAADEIGEEVGVVAAMLELERIGVVVATLELEEEVVAATADDEELNETTVELEATALLVALLPASVETLLDPVGTSPARTHPVLAVRAAGHSTCTKSTVGLSAPSNQSYRQSQPG